MEGAPAGSPAWSEPQASGIEWRSLAAELHAVDAILSPSRARGARCVTSGTEPGSTTADLQDVPSRAARLAFPSLALAAGLAAGCATPPPTKPPAGVTAHPAPHVRPPMPLPAPAPPAASVLGWPVRGPILSGFGAVRGRRHHQGIDVQARRGATVVAAAEGRVVESRWRRGYGNVVTLDHGDGVETVYAHLAEIWVRPDAWAARGDPLGTVGATGNATTPHLHFEVRRDGRARDPLAWLPEEGDAVASPGELD